MQMQPIKITATLESGICTNDAAIPLDGILMAAALQSEYGPDWQSVLPDPNIELVYPQVMPLEKREHQSEWYYACSFARHTPLAETVQYWHKRTRLQYLEMASFGKKGKLDLGSGPYRNYRMPLQTIVTPEVTWYAFGDLDTVAVSLSQIDFIGKKRAYGNGGVIEWKVETIGEDYSEQKDGKRTRAVPLGKDASESDILKYGQVAFRSFRPPYWHRENFGWCLV